MLFARTFALLGRWGTRDFLRGRSKRGGAVHIRHTHGSKGRYKRLSSRYGLRDGRRHAGNHMKGGLGIKLGGGLFGLRIPRQHALSTMSREEFELEVYGHPNVTNPYRTFMQEHPALRQVMANAAPRASLVVLLPRASRHVGGSSTGACAEGGETDREPTGGATANALPLPTQWQAVAEELASLLTPPPLAIHEHREEGSSPASLHRDGTATVAPQPSCSSRGGPSTSQSCVTDLYLCTVDASTHVVVPAAAHRALLTSELTQQLRALYATYCLVGRRLTRHECDPPRRASSDGGGGGGGGGGAVVWHAVTANRTARPFLGPALSSPSMGRTLFSAPAADWRGGGDGRAPTRSPRARLDALAAGRHSMALAGDCAAQLLVPPAPSNVSAVVSSAGDGDGGGGGGGGCRAHSSVGTALGVAAVWRQLRQQHADALCLCLRPSSLISGAALVPRAEAHGSDGRPCANVDARAERLPEASRPLAAVEAASPRATARRPPLLRREVDVDEEVGVWRRPSRGSAADAMKWFYSTRDPRAHCADALSHEQRRLPVLLLVDASKLRYNAVGRDGGSSCDGGSGQPASAGAARKSGDAPVRSLLSRQHSVELERSGFHALSDESLSSVLQAMSRWATDRQWAVLQALRAASSGGACDGVEVSSAAAEEPRGCVSADLMRAKACDAQASL